MEKKKDIIGYHPTLLDRKIKNLKIDSEHLQCLFTLTAFVVCCDLIEYTIDPTVNTFGSVVFGGAFLGIQYDAIKDINDDIKMLIKRKYGE